MPQVFQSIRVAFSKQKQLKLHERLKADTRISVLSYLVMDSLEPNVFINEETLFLLQSLYILNPFLKQSEDIIKLMFMANSSDGLFHLVPI